MSKHDLQARPIYHHLRESIEAHLTIVMAALAVSNWIETTTGWSIRTFVKTTRRYRTITIQAGDHTITAADPLPTTSPKPSTPSAHAGWTLNEPSQDDHRRRVLGGSDRQQRVEGMRFTQVKRRRDCLAVSRR